MAANFWNPELYCPGIKTRELPTHAIYYIIFRDKNHGRHWKLEYY